METKQENVEAVSSVNSFGVTVIIALAFASGYMAARSVLFNPAGLMTVAHIQVGGAIASIVLIACAFSLQKMVVTVSRKRSR